MKQVITLEICGKEVEAEIDFTFVPKVPARVCGLPENCWPEEPEQWEIHSVYLRNSRGNFLVCVTELVDYIEDELIELLRDTLNYCGNYFVSTDLGTENNIAEPVKPNKYLRTITNQDGDKMVVDVYDVIEAFAITCPAISHAAKKVLCAGLRGHKDQLTDIQDVIDSMERAKQLHKNREVPFE